MDEARVERRRGRRVQLQAPMLIRRTTTPGPEPFEEEVTRDISIAGIYFETERGAYAVNDCVVTSVTIPDAQRRTFPFTRLAGRSRVVRVKPPGPELGTSTRKRFGVALEFGDDCTILTALPAQG